jgi:hypothetical protein
MIEYSWKFLELFANGDELISVRYLLVGSNDKNTVESEGKHEFEKGTVSKPLSEIVESDLVQWIEKDTTKDDVNPIKLAIENQLNSLEKEEKVDFPWLVGTFTIE